MDEDRSRENEEIKTGLELSDTEGYNVSAGSSDEVLDKEQPGRKKPRSGGKGVAAFTAGFIACLAVLFILCYVFGIGKFLSEKQFRYY